MEAETKDEPDCSCVALHLSSKSSTSVDAFEKVSHHTIIFICAFHLPTSGAAVFIHSSILLLIFIEKLRYENSPEYSALIHVRTWPTAAQ